MKIYGIKSCDTMKKAFTWLNNNSIEYLFFDYKKKILLEDKFNYWLEKLPLEQIVNKQGTTYKKLTDEQKVAIQNPATAFDIIKVNTSAIKRPLIEINDQVIVGFNET
ncbi:MAG: Spx/MgsR family RNA polymerase-binding regulatory protein, partial [Bacteroidia bacterium]